MTLDDLEHQNRAFYGFFGDFGLRYTFQKRIAPKSLKTDQDNLHTKFSPLNVDFNGLSFDLLDSRKPAHEGIKERYPVILPLLPSLAWKPLQVGMDMLPITTSTSDELFSRIKIDDFKIP